jgi:hypothetical protein
MYRHSLRAAALGILGLALALPARAADDTRVDAALKLLPADAAFYASSLRLREQFDSVAKSKAWAKITALPAYKMARQAVRAKMTDDPQAKAFFEQLEKPENRELIELLKDVVSREVFFYGGGNFSGLLDLMQQMNGAQQFASLGALVQGKTNPRERLEAQGRAMLRVLNENLDLVRVPDLIVGFKVSDAKRAESQLARLEQLVKGMEDQFPPELRGRLKRVKVGGGSFLNFTVDGEMVPWDQIPIKDYEETEGQYDALIKKLKGLKLSVTLGVREGYLLLAVGASPQVVTAVGGEGPRLAGRPEFKPLAAHAGKRMLSIGYASKELRARAGTSPKDVDHAAETVRELLKQAGLPEEQVKKIQKDVEDIARDVKKAVPEPGATVEFSFRTDRGQEGYEYDYTKYPDRGAARPLTLLHHVGGDPLFFLVARAESNPQDYKTFSRKVRTLYGHVEEALLAKLDDDQKEKYEQVTKVVFPLLRRVDTVTGDMLLPALRDGQSGLVLDAKWRSKRWHQNVPETPETLPLPELGLVFGVSDAALLRKAMTSYREAVNEAIAKAREAVPQAPPFEIPPPQEETVKGGTIYFYPLPRQAGLDPQVLPNAGLSDKVAVLTLSKAHSERLLADRPPKLDGGPLADPSRPLVAAAHFNCPALLEAVRPWVEFGIQSANLPPVPGAEGDGGDWLSHARVLLDVFKVFRGYSSATYIEDGVLVTHSESIIRDID